jgi:hypothetical protein
LLQYTTTILQFGQQGEKTGWTYITIPQKITQQLKPDYKKSFRVKGKLDEYVLKGIALIPMGEGNFIMPLNAEIRKGIKKGKGAKVNVSIEVDDDPVLPSAELMECLKDEPEALANFNKLPKSHQNYYTRWIDSAKTVSTRAKRITQAVNALVKGFHYGEMVRGLKADRDKMG